MRLGDIDGTTTSSLRRINAAAVVRHLRRSGSSESTSAIASATGLTRPTIEGALEELLRAQLVAEVEPSAARRSAGRPGRRFRFRAEAGFAAGVDLRPDRIRIEILDLAGTTVGQSYEEGLSLGAASAAVQKTEERLVSLLAELDIPRAQLGSIAVAVPGVVDNDGALWKSTVVADWVDGNLGQLIGARFPRVARVIVDNAANHASLAESVLGAGIGAESMVLILVDEGVGAGVVLGGNVVRGRRGAAGEVGVLETLRWNGASDALARATHDSVANVAHVASLSPEAQAAFRNYASDIALGAAAMVLAYDPEIVVFGGVVALADEEFFAVLRDELSQLCLYPPDLARSALGEPAVARGAAARALEELEERIIPQQPTV